jgi:superfamily I DNA/RNA helicase
VTFEGFADPLQQQVPLLDASQRAVLALAPDESAVVVGAPGSGKTTTLVELLADRVGRRGFSADEVLALTTSRTTATRLRDRLGVRLSVATNGPLARTVASVAFDLVGSAARRAGLEPPGLITGGEQDGDIAALLAGEVEDGRGPNWPDPLTPQVRALRGFRSELRELMARATELGVSPERLRALGAAHGHPEWAASADFIDDYLSVIAGARQDQLDSAELVQFAVAAVQRGEVSDAVGKLRLVVIDDAQEATVSTMALLHALSARGVAVVAFGDPDVAANVFRGGEPDVLGRFGERLGARSRTLFLDVVHRQRPALREFTSRITERIGTAGVVGHRAARAAADPDAVPTDRDALPPPPVATILAPSAAREYAAVARVLREHHVLRGVPWRSLAVVVRSGSQVPALARALGLAEVPTRTAVGATALRDDQAARALLTVIDVGSGRSILTAEVATQLLLGPFGGLDRLALRRLRLALRAEELAGDGTRQADELIVDALNSPGRLSTIDAKVARSADRLARTLAELGAQTAAGASIEELLWLAWERSGLAVPWHDQAVGTGVLAAEANRNLDGVLALFTAAKRFVEREPDSPARVFLERVLDAEVPEDTLSPRPLADAVLVTTPPGTVGEEFEVVAIAGLQDGVWPDLRVRGSLLHPQRLVQIVTGEGDAVLDARRLVLADELRMFALAVSRARTQVILAAASNDDEAASTLFSLAPDGAPALDPNAHPLSLRGLTSRLRRELTTRGRSAAERNAAASALARLASERVTGADPAQWHGLIEPSTTDPLYAVDEQVPVSPSKLEAFEESPLDWFIDTVSGSQASVAMGLGTIVHWAMETAPGADVEAIWAAIQQRWPELPFESAWLSEQQLRAARTFAVGLADYLADFERDGKRLAAAEPRFELELERAVLRGAIDRVEVGPHGEIVIVDLKTGHTVPRAADIPSHAQLSAYQLAYQHGSLDESLGAFGEHRGGGAKLLFVRGGVRGKAYRESVQSALSSEQLAEFRARVTAAAERMAQAQFDAPLEISDWGGPNIARKRLQRVPAVSSDGAGSAS